MEWVLSSPQIHSTFGNLGFVHAGGYHINENCNAALQSILDNILTEDQYLRSYRRSISFGQNIQKDLVPLLLHAKEDTTIELLVQILVNLTIPVECLLSVEVISQSDFGKQTVHDINNLLTSAKVAFADIRTSKVVIEFLKKNADTEQLIKITPRQCSNINNSLLLMRNLLHIPEGIISFNPSNNETNHPVQNRIIWNIFSQGFDKLLIKLMIIPELTNWGVTMVQLVALLYKDQHVTALYKLVNSWLGRCASDTSEDNESNTSPPDRGSEDSSLMLTSDPTSDSSDTGGSGKSNDAPNYDNNQWGASSGNNISENENQLFQPPLPEGNDIQMGEISEHEALNNEERMTSENVEKILSESVQSKMIDQQQKITNEEKAVISENSDRGYGTQIENQESISTSSNDDEVPAKKPSHQKPHNTKQRKNNKARSGLTLQERKRKKINRRSKAKVINIRGLAYQTPTDDDISDVLKEFTVDFILKGYNSLVQTLHNQILTNLQLEIDTSHFFWLITYFLKYTNIVQLDLEQFISVISYDIFSYVTAEGVNLCEQFELAIKLDGNNLKPSLKRLHLAVTAIRELVQAVMDHQKRTNISVSNKKSLVTLQNKLSDSDELRSLLVLLLRHYNPKYHTKQYLQDLILTNHILLRFVDTFIGSPDYTGALKIEEHIRQFATPDIMFQYGLLLEDYAANEDFINDCIFTMMHHVGGELGSLICLFQPTILKTFTSIWETKFEICEDWNDLINYVINTFVKKPQTLYFSANFRLETESFDDDMLVNQDLPTFAPGKEEIQPVDSENKKYGRSNTSNSSKERWTDEELSSLSWKYLQCNILPDVIGEIVKCLKEDGTTKSRDSVIKELLRQNLINKEEFDRLSNGERDNSSKNMQINKEIRDVEIGKLCEQLRQDGKVNCFYWVQKVLLETCFAKIYLKKKAANKYLKIKEDSGIMQFKLFNQEFNELPIMSPVSYQALLHGESVPLVPWNCEQAAFCKDLRFLQLLHKLGFQMPVDTGKVFIRIPHFWTAKLLYEVAGKVALIDTTKLKFSVSDVYANTAQQCRSTLSGDPPENMRMVSSLEAFYQIHKQNHLATMLNFTRIHAFDFQNENNRDWLMIASELRNRPAVYLQANPTNIINAMDLPILGQSISTQKRQPSQARKPGSAFNSKCVQTNDSNRKRSWLEVVQQSKDFKYTCGMASIPDEAACPLSPLGPRGAPESPEARGEQAAPPAPGCAASQDANLLIAHLSESEDNNSVCETASVASDLTRMYVSDEDEKTDIKLRPKLKVRVRVPEGAGLARPVLADPSPKSPIELIN